jgi:hypothetical protein
MSNVLAMVTSAITRIENLLSSQKQDSGKRSGTWNTNAQTDLSCVFCGELGHFINGCPLALEYIKSGKCIWNVEGKMCLPSGRFLPRSIVGKHLAERFDKYYEMYQSQNVQPTTTAVFEAGPTIQYAHITGQEDVTDNEEPDEDTLAGMVRIFASEVANKIDKGKKKAGPAKATNQSGSKLPPPPVVVITPPPVTRPSKPEKVERSDVQYHYQAPVESPATIQQVFERTLDIPLRVTQRELLVISGDIRKKMKDIVTARHVPVTSNPVQDAMYTNAIPSDDSDLVVAVDAAPLRTVEGILDGRITTECLLDQGSSIVAMRRDVWEKLGVPLHSERVLHMESSHGTIAPTLGQIKNFPIQIGPCTFRVQMQVADKLPCEVLIGRPFFMLTGSQTIDHPHGAQDLILNDPNTGERIIVPTKERVPHQTKRPDPDF